MVMTRYATHPMEQSFNEWNLEYKAKRDEYWRRLQRAWADYQAGDHGPYGEPNFSSFKYFMERRYGLRVNMTGGNIGDTYVVVNDAKHSLFLLKYA